MFIITRAELMEEKKKELRVAFVSDAAFPWHKGGLEAVERTEADELAKVYDVHFLSLRWPDMPSGLEFIDNGVHFHPLAGTDINKFYRHGRRSIRTSVKFALSSLRIFRYLLGKRFDVIEANVFPFLHVPIVRLYCRLTGCRLILDVVEVWSREYWLEYLGPIGGRLGRWFAMTFCFGADHYIANSSTTAGKLEREGVASSRISVFAPILDDSAIRKVMLEPARRSPRVVFWGRLIKEKRLDRWLSVMREVTRRMPSARGTIVGGGPESANVGALIRKMGLSGKVEHKPFIERGDDLFRLVRSSSVLLHMSEREGLGLIALESLALGVPVVLPSYSPIPREVKEMCIVEEEQAIPERVLQILKSKDKGRFIRHREGLKRFEISNTVPFYSDLFRRLGLR